MGNRDDNNIQISSTRPDGMMMQIVTSLLCIGIGALLIFVPGIDMLYLCYCFCAALIVVGITLIISYFVSEAYRKLNDYRFAAGVLLVILGCIELLRAHILAEEIVFIIGFVTLILAVIIMQSTVQMRILKSGAWIVQLIFTLISLVGAVMVLTDFSPVMSRVQGFPYIVMLATGTMCLISLVIEAIVLRIVGRREVKEAGAGSDAADTQAEDASPDDSGNEPSDTLTVEDKEKGIGKKEAEASASEDGADKAQES